LVEDLTIIAVGLYVRRAEKKSVIIPYKVTLGLRVPPKRGLCDYEMHERSAIYEARYSTKTSGEDYRAKSQARFISQ
jgi:hypothetical protein